MKKLQLKNNKPVDEKKKYINLFRLSVDNPKFHRNTPDEIFFIDYYNYNDNNALPFIFLRFNNENKLFYGKPGTIHGEILPKIQQYLMSRGYKPSDITGSKSEDEYINTEFIQKGQYLDLFNEELFIKGRYFIVDVPVINQKCAIFGFWFMHKYPMELTNEIIYNVCKERKLFDRRIYIVNGSKPLINYNEFNPGPSEDEIEDNTERAILHMLPGDEKWKQTADFRKTRDQQIGKKLTMSNGKEMPMAQYNALRYVDESKKETKPKRIVYMTEAQIKHIEEQMLLNEITIYDKYGIEKKNGKTQLDFATYSKICLLDPTSVVVNNQRQAGKYCNWLLQHFNPEMLNDRQYCHSIMVALEQYNDGIKKGILKRSGISNDIGSFKTIESLLDTIKQIMGGGTNISMSTSNAMEKLNGQYEIIGESPNWYIVIPKTFQAERFFGSHTEWCTVANSDYFNGYTRRGPLYITFPKNGDNKLKMQFHFSTNSFASYDDEVYKNPKVCIYNVLGDGDEFDEVCGMWKKASAAFANYTFVKLSEVPELLKHVERLNEVFDYVYANNRTFITVGLNGRYNVVKKTESGYELLSPNKWFYNIHGFFNNEVGKDSFVVEVGNERYNALNANGELLFNEDVINLGKIYYGWAVVRLDHDTTYKWNYINEQGQLLLSQNVFNVKDFDQGYGKFAVKGYGWNLVKPDGKIVFDRYFRDVYPALGKHGQFIVELGTDTYDVLREDGTSLTPNQKYVEVRSKLEYNGYVVKIELPKDNIIREFYLKADGTLCTMFSAINEPRPIPQEELDRLGIKIQQPQQQAEYKMVSENKKKVYFTESQIDDIRQRLQQARQDTDTNPTEKQKEAGNYKLGRVKVLDYEVAIENPKGTYRRGKDKNGHEWKTLMNYDYGYFTHTLGYDGDAIDVFLGTHFDTYSIFAIDQKTKDGEFDETKIMLGFRNEKEAKDAYMSCYEKGWKGFWKITEVPHTVFQKWLYDGYQQRKPFFEYSEIQKKKLNENVDFYKKNKFKMSGENMTDFAHVIDEVISEYENNDTSMILTKESIDEIVDNNELQSVVSSFDVQKQLNPKFWVNGKLNSRVRLRLLDIADIFFDSLDVNWVKPKDIIMTGSLANYNWSKYSDIDLHILVDFKEVDERVDFVKNYFDSKKKIWNEEHEDLTIYGYPVELYVQDINEEHTASGIYSLEKNEWLKEPEKDDLTAVKLDKETIADKTKKIADTIENLETACEEEKDTEKLDILSNKVKKLFDRIKGMRKDALKNGGSELSVGNLIFKSLRRLGYIGRLVDLKRVTFDKINSIK